MTGEVGTADSRNTPRLPGLRRRMRSFRSARSLCSLPARWTKRATKELGGKDPAALLTKQTAEGIDVKPLYMSSDLPAGPPDGETPQ